MLTLQDISRIYFIGAGGIGMSAIERFFLSRNVVVSGYDKTPTPLTRQLETEGVHIHYTDDVELLDKDVQLVVYTPAIPAHHTELNWYRNNGYPVVKRSDVLQIITESSFNICVAGTHGKTTISSMTGHVLRHTGYGCNAFLGGIAVNYNTNFWSSANNVCVVEADEYDRSFLKLSPDIAIVTAMDADHLDIYGTVEAMQDAFVQFAARVKPGGLLLRKQALVKLNEAEVRRQLTYELHRGEHAAHCNDPAHDHRHDEVDEVDVFAENLRTDHGSYWFDANISGHIIKDMHLNIGGLHNVENALAAITVAKALKIADEKIKAAIEDFKGVKRRFEYVVKQDGLVFIDDYAHHPEELRALINSAKNLFPGMACTVVFQPHLFTRTRDLATGFAEVLDLADEVLLLPIYPARELPVEGVTSQVILEKMNIHKKAIVNKAELMNWAEQNKPALFITAGAGDIDALVEGLAAKLGG